MQITPIGYVLAAASLLVLLSGWNRLLYLVIFFAPFSATSLLNIDALTFGVTPYIFFAALYCGAALLTGSYRSATRPAPFRDTVLLGAGAFLLLAICATLMAGLAGHAGMGNITQLGYLLLGIVMTGVVAFVLEDPGVRDKAFRAMRYGGMFVAIWGFFQLATNYAGVEYPDWAFNNSVSDFADMYDQKLVGGIHRISSVAVEPSFLAFSLIHVFAFSSTRLTLAPASTWSKELPTVLLTGICLVLSTSTTAYVGLAVCLLMLMLTQPVRMFILFALGVVVAMVVLQHFSSFANVLDGVTLGKFDSWSFKDRFASTQRGWELFLEKPVLGGGWGASVQDSLPVTLLANTGMAGLACFGLTMIWTLAGTANAIATSPRAADRELWLDCAGCQTALYASLTMNAASGFKYVVFDFWFMWGACIATVAALQWSRGLAGNSRPAFFAATRSTEFSLARN